MKKIYEDIHAIHYYEWIHLYRSSIFFRSILENWTLFGPISSDPGHLKSYKYSYITNIIDSWYKSFVIINLFMFTIDIWIDSKHK